ncbi:1-(5-phosphoribosyl)-5-[(5-phosphoribosylamino)methylideneamino]imidazole-4-carboxamide isomerase [Methanosphaera sp.]|uniref:1-(5-phosphoribosyl)-5-[(5- phosphoribosylamino)methylideneamino]imidazole-4- carboxamide isomerase n=1 Tax=Methanosphaera sp. TaxID=2666342 RepID=UPI0025FD1258|nr:1-(5-phosphoribosyl)-5-[(5-phosphoribosylamino)methylideneamino]imidazole-4-carboxamide isomerase [Methanosphaera sp.]MEE3324352.1 1-(5-phosphoribosyl)-5-[(5-phosphoribosylamino)methylideneamino]imidazole-4-carboxamide isomerase [Methanosphaera sp.]MEE3418754.1 1-(5-phosphoribosyl)-5-[(5-phosphoribosylamino)methylideneamino]imidazole-4-carboxamide isomerase [Methanosphaera sp.]
MIIIPAVDLKNGKCVQLVQGEPGTEQVIIDNPDEVAMNWIQKGAKRLHVVDLDGALGSGENLNIVKKIIEKSQVPVQMGGGIRTLDDAKKLLDAGITTVIIGTMAIKNPEYIEQLSEEYGSERICVSLDSKDNKVVTHGWTEFTDKSPLEYAKIFEEKGAGSILFTNVDVEGLLKGIDLKPVKELLSNLSIPIIYSGGITSLDDLKVLYDLGTDYVVIGSALYKGVINFEDTIQFQK